MNEALCTITGYSEPELRELTFQEITHPDDLEADLDLVRQTISGEIDTYAMEKRYLHKDGHVVWVLLSVSLVRADSGEPDYFISQIQDITEGRRSREALERSEALLTEAQHVAHIGSWEWTVETDVLNWSAELYEMFEVDPGAPVTYARYLDRIHPDDLSLVEAAVEKAGRTGESYQIEHRVILTTGEVRWIHGRGQVTLGPDGPIAMWGTAQDFTERKQAEDELRRVELRYRTLVEQLPLGMYIRPLDMSRPNLYASPQLEPMIGYPAEHWEANAQLLSTIVHPEDRDRVLSDATAIRETGKSYRDEYRCITPDGRIVWVQDETFLVSDEDGEPYVMGFWLDITDRKNAEAERDRLREALHDAQKLEAIGRLAGGVAHDFNNMLTAIKGYGELLLAGLQPGTRQYHEAEQIRRAAEQASSLPEQLLSFARKQPLEARVVDLNDLVAAATTLLRHLVGERVELIVIPSPHPALARVDPERIEQTLVNLALNARDAMPTGGSLTIAVSTESRGETVRGQAERATGDREPAGSYAVISVTDDGEGMDAETRERAFEPFFTTKPKGVGSGLGLASVHGTVVQSGGSVRLASAPGQGTTVWLSFPSTTPETVRAGSMESRPTPVVLVAEDETLVRELVSSVLSSEGWDVHEARDGVEALEVLDRLDCPLDLLITDLVMPRMSGLELGDHVAARQPQVKTVFISGYSDDKPVTDNGAHPGSVFVSKPFSPFGLLRAVNHVMTGDASPPSDAHPVTAPDQVTCVIADDHPAVLDSVSRYLESSGIAIVGRATRADEAVREIVSHRPVTALVDITMEPFSGIEVARQTAAGSPQTSIVMYTGHHDQALLRDALEAGARGFVLKQTPLSELLVALTTVAAGGTYVDALLADALTTAATAAPLVTLTKREREILTLLSGGMTNERAATELGISAETIQSHVRNAMTKLDADTRTQAVATAIRQALIV